MRASQVLQKYLCDSLEPMHALREAVLLRSVEALIAAQRLTLTRKTGVRVHFSCVQNL